MSTDYCAISGIMLKLYICMCLFGDWCGQVKTEKERADSELELQTKVRREGRCDGGEETGRGSSRRRGCRVLASAWIGTAEGWKSS
jgi:hypothetical protein